MPSFTSNYKSEFIALINEVEAKLKEIIVVGINKNENVKETEKKVNQLIRAFANQIPDDYEEKENILKSVNFTKKILYRGYKRDTELAFQKAKDEMGTILGVKVANREQLMSLLLSNLSRLDATRIKDVGLSSNIAFQQGTPYIADYYKRVRTTLSKLIDQGIVEPPRMLKKGLSLRSLAELSIRHQFHQEEIEKFKENEVKLVWISTHADSSQRCATFQGRLFSLNGKSGKAGGHKYEPLEKATQIPYTTKGGRKYMNGLFGFNCRHRMIEYQPQSQPPMDYSASEIKKEREITNKQRAMERMIYKKRLQAHVLRHVDKVVATQVRKEATDLFKVYKEYSHKNNHAVYPDRCSISKRMIEYVQGAI